MYGVLFFLLLSLCSVCVFVVRVFVWFVGVAHSLVGAEVGLAIDIGNTAWILFGASCGLPNRPFGAEVVLTLDNGNTASR